VSRKSPEVSAASRSAASRSAASRRGLSQTVAAAADLLAEGDRAHAGIPTDARDLLLEEIAPDPEQARRRFDEAELRALAEDIARRGVLQPILVRPPADPDGRYRLVAGERRWRAAALAGRVRIPARIKDLSDEEVQAAQLAENVLRSGLTDIEKGRALRRLYELRKAQDPKTVWEDIAAEVGLGRARIHDLFHLAALPEPVARLIESGRLSGSHGIALQRAQGALAEAEIIALAESAARGESKGVGGFGMPVARLRREIQSRLEGRGEEINRTEPSELRSFVRRTLEALATDALTSQERQALRTALERSEAPVSSPTGGVNSN
jgi:ParB family chromosome partitioning protein